MSDLSTRNLEWNENIVLIAYPHTFGEKQKLISKIEALLSEFKDFLFIAVDDKKQYIKDNYSLHLLEEVDSYGLSDKEIESILSRCTHCLIFWDGTNHNQFLYQTFAQKKPHRVIPVNTTKVANKDRYELYDVYIGRRGKWGNPFIIGKDGDRDEVIAKYKTYFYNEILKDPQKKKELESLKGKTLGCHCKPLPCHGDVIAEYLNTLEVEDNFD